MPRMATVTEAATLIHQSTAEDGDLVDAKNTGAKGAFVGKDDQVTIATGFPLAAGATQQFDLEAGQQLFAICASGDTTTVVVL